MKGSGGKRRVEIQRDTGVVRKVVNFVLTILR